MKNIFSVDGKLYSILSKVVDLFVVAILWIVGCIPVVTIITSTSSMYQTVVKCIRYDEGTIFSEFKDAYRKNLRQGIGLTVLYGVVGAVIGLADYYLFIVSINRSGLFFIFAVELLVLSAMYILNLLWIIPVFSRFSDTFGNILKLNYVIAMKNILRSVPMIMLIVVALILFLGINELVFFLPSLIILINSYLSEPALWRYMPESEETHYDWRYGRR